MIIDKTLITCWIADMFFSYIHIANVKITLVIVIFSIEQYKIIAKECIMSFRFATKYSCYLQ